MLPAPELLLATCRPVDQVRARLLRLSLRTALARSLWTDRAGRHAAMFGALLVVNLILALVAPLWVLALGPALLGAVHLVATAQYAPRALAGVNGVRVDTWTRRAAAVLGLSMVLGLVLPQGVAAPVAVALFTGSVGIAALVLDLPAGARVGAVMLAVAVAAAVLGFLPAALGALVLLHNLVAFIHWCVQAPTGRERRAAGLATALFVAATAALFLVPIDLASAQLWSFPGLSADDIGRSILPWSASPKAWRAATAAYALGQSLHYFVWLRALPEAADRRPTPCSFRQSAARLQRLLGVRGAWAACALAVLMSASWLWLAFPDARRVYFAVAAYHGFAEMAPLVLLAAAALARKRV